MIEMLTISEAAKRTGRSERDIRRAIVRSKLPVRWGKRAQISVADLQRWVERLEQEISE